MTQTPAPSQAQPPTTATGGSSNNSSSTSKPLPQSTRPPLSLSDLGGSSGVPPAARLLGKIGPRYHLHRPGGGNSTTWEPVDQPLNCTCSAAKVEASQGEHLSTCSQHRPPAPPGPQSGRRKKQRLQLKNWNPTLSYVCGCQTTDGHRTGCTLAGRA